MKTLKQLLRQPVKTLFGILLMTLAAAVLITCVGQALAAQATKKALDERFSTIAVPLVKESEDRRITTDMMCLDEELLAWLEKAAKEHPDVLKGISRHGILSAYIPELTPMLITADKYEKWADSWVVVEEDEYGHASILPYEGFDASPVGMPQSCAMFVITLEKAEYLNTKAETILSDPNPLTWEDFETTQEYIDYFNTLDIFNVTYGQYYALTGTITQVVSLPEGCRDIVGMTARLKLKVPTEEAFVAMALEPGQQYIVYGMDFFDLHWQLSGEFREDGIIAKIDPYDPSLLKMLTEDDKGENSRIVAKYDGVQLNQENFEKLNSVSMTLDGPLSFNKYEKIYDENGNIVDVVEQTQVKIANLAGETATISNEEYQNLYNIPNIARLDGSVEDFLNSEEGALWRKAIARDKINNHVSAVIGVDRMHYLETFAFGNSKITEGRDFTQGELDNGARVCIVNAKVAALNGLQVGDTITLNMYAPDLSLPYQKNRTDGSGLLDPLASFYFDTTPFADIAQYTIVGLWQGNRTWADLSLDQYTISANTIFVPKSSVQATMETCNSVLFNTVAIENGQLDTFKTLLTDAGLLGSFRYNDQGYGEIAANFHDFQTLSKEVLTIGVVVYVILLLLFLLLYPGSHRKTVKVMQALGCGFCKRCGHALLSSTGILIPASVLGALLGTMLWSKVVTALQTFSEAAVSIQMQPDTLTAVVAAQLLFALMLNAFVTLFVAAPRGISAQR